MNEMIKSKERYDNILIPKELNEIVQNSIMESEQKRQKKKGNRKKKLMYQWGLGMAATLVITTTIGVNTSEAFAMEMQKIPVVGTLVKILTIRSYEEDDGDKKVSVVIPQVELADGSVNGFSKEINDKINDQCNAYAAEAQLRADEYKEAFIETGGTQEEWAAHDIQIKVWYDVKSQSTEYLSFAVSGTESWTSAYAETKFYNLDLKNNQYLSLEHVLGKDYITIVNQAIQSQMETRTNESGDVFWTVAEGGFDTINENTRYYMNEKGNPMIVFDKYEIAPGYQGEVEFEIEIE